MFPQIFGCCAAAALTLLSLSAPAADRYYRGNLHTHSLWSDADDYPEIIVDWYKSHGYNFLALSDHNRMLIGERWINVASNGGGGEVLKRYVQKFGPNWVQQREENGQTLVRLRALEEFRGKFEEAGKFLMIPGEEISDHFENLPIHLNASNLRDLIKPQGGSSVADVIQRDVSAVVAQREATGIPMISHINHPNFRWALTAEDIMGIQGDRFLEIYNGHPITWNAGDTNHPSHERIWDIVLTKRLAELGLDPIWGTAVDDSHNYSAFGLGHANPGRGWIMVKAGKLEAKSLIAALEKGDFYASSGTRIKAVHQERKSVRLDIDPEPGVTYETVFIGTRRGYDSRSEEVLVDGKPLRATRKYSPDIGQVLARATGEHPAYELKGDEIYVRAKVISSKPKENPMAAGEYECAWIQPRILFRARPGR